MKKFGLNCYLQIIYQKDDLLDNFTKLDLKSLKFVDFNDNTEKETKYLYEVNAHKLEYIVNNILKSKVVQDLSRKNIRWLNVFEEKLSKESTVLNNKKLLFNYLILKLQTVGFDEQFSLDYAKYIIALLNNNYIDIYDLLKLKENVDLIYKSKEYFIIYNLGDFKKSEINLLKLFLITENSNSQSLDFRNFKKTLIIQDQQSFAKYCFDNNKKNLDFQSNKKYTLTIYKHLITEYLNEILSLSNLKFDYIFFEKLIRFLCSTLNKVIDTWNY